LYVSWDIPKKKKEKIPQQDEEEDFPNLMNLKKMADTYRRGA
jgi:hypothetical protein